VGDGPCIRHSNILRSRPTVIRCEAKYELTKNGLKKKLFVVKSRFLVKKRVMCCIMLYIRVRNKNRKIESMTKKRGHQKFWALEWTFFLEKVIQKFVLRIFVRPSKLGAVSAHAVYPCVTFVQCDYKQRTS